MVHMIFRTRTLLDAWPLLFSLKKQSKKSKHPVSFHFLPKIGKICFERPIERTFAFAYLEGPSVGKADLLQKACFNRSKAKSMVTIPKDSTNGSRAHALSAPKEHIAYRGCVVVTSSINAAQFTKRSNIKSLNVLTFGINRQKIYPSLRAKQNCSSVLKSEAVQSSTKAAGTHISRESSKKENFVYQYLLAVLLRTEAVGFSMKEIVEKESLPCSERGTKGIGSIVSDTNRESKIGLPSLAASSGKIRLTKVAPFGVNSLANERLSVLSNVQRQTTGESINSAVLYWQSRIHSNSSSLPSFVVGSLGLARTISKTVKNILKTDLSFPGPSSSSSHFRVKKKEGLFSQNQSFLCFWLFPFVGFMFTLGKNDVPTYFKELSPLLINSRNESVLQEGVASLPERTAAVLYHPLKSEVFSSSGNYPKLLFPSISKQGVDNFHTRSLSMQTTLASWAEDQAAYLAHTTENSTGGGFIQNALFDRRLAQVTSGLSSSTKNPCQAEKNRSFFGCFARPYVAKNISTRGSSTRGLGDAGTVKYSGIGKENIQKQSIQASSINPLNNFCLKLLVASSSTVPLFEQEPLNNFRSKRKRVCSSPSERREKGLSSGIITQKGIAFSIDSFIKASRLLDNYYKNNDATSSSRDNICFDFSLWFPKGKTKGLFQIDQDGAKRIRFLPFAKQKSVEKVNYGFFAARPSQTKKEAQLLSEQQPFFWDGTRKSPSSFVELSSINEKVGNDSQQLSEKVVQFLKRKVLLNFVSVSSLTQRVREAKHSNFLFAMDNFRSKRNLRFSKPSLRAEKVLLDAFEKGVFGPRFEQEPMEFVQKRVSGFWTNSKGSYGTGPLFEKESMDNFQNFSKGSEAAYGTGLPSGTTSLEVPVAMLLFPKNNKERTVYTKLSKESLYKLLFYSLNSVNDALPRQSSINFDKVEGTAASHSNYGTLKLRHPILMSVCLPENLLAFGKKSYSFAPFSVPEILKTGGQSKESFFSLHVEQESFSDGVMEKRVSGLPSGPKPSLRADFIASPQKKVHNMHLKNKFNSKLFFPHAGFEEKAVRITNPSGPLFEQELASPVGIGRFSETGSFFKRGPAGQSKSCFSYASVLKQITFKIQKNFLLSRMDPYFLLGTISKNKDKSKKSDQVHSFSSRDPSLLSLREERDKQRGFSEEQVCSKREVRTFVPVATPEKLVRAYFSVKKASSNFSKIKGLGFTAPLRAENKREDSSSVGSPLTSLETKHFFGRDWKQRLLLRKQFVYGMNKNIHNRNKVTSFLWETNNIIFPKKNTATALPGREVGQSVDLTNFRRLATSLLSLSSNRANSAFQTSSGKRGTLQSYGLRTLALKKARLFLSHDQSFSPLQVAVDSLPLYEQRKVDALMDNFRSKRKRSFWSNSKRRVSVSSLETATRSQNLDAVFPLISKRENQKCNKLISPFMFPKSTNVYSPHLLIKNRFVFSARRESENYPEKRVHSKEGQEDLLALKQQFFLTFGKDSSLPGDSKEQEQRKNNQKKRRRKKLKKETRRRKKRKIFYPKPLWMRYRIYSSLLNKRYKSTFDFANPLGTKSKSRGPLSDSIEEQEPVDNFHNSRSLYEQRKQKTNPKGSYRTRFLSFSSRKQPPSANQNLSGLFKTAIGKRPWDANLSIQKEGTLQETSKKYFTISRSVLEEFKRVLWKSNWLRANLTPYLKSVTHILNEIKESTKRMELFKNVYSFLNLIGRQSLNINQVGLQTFVDKNDGTSGESLTFVPSLSWPISSREARRLPSLGQFPAKKFSLLKDKACPAKNDPRKGQTTTHRLLNKSCWENSLYVEEYNRITYERLQQFISQIRENSLFLKPLLVAKHQATSPDERPSVQQQGTVPYLEGSAERLWKAGQVSTQKSLLGDTLTLPLSQRASQRLAFQTKIRATHFSHSQKQAKKKQEFLLSIQPKSIWVTLGKTIMSVATSFPTLTNVLGEKTRMTSFGRAGHATVFSNHQSFHSPSGLAVLQRGLTFDFLSFYKKNVWKEELSLPQLRMYWALSKTSYNFAPFVSQNLTDNKDSNNGAKCKTYMKKLWSSPKNKAREQSKYNKTKKMDRDISIKFQLFLNKQYELTQKYGKYELERIAGKSPVSYSVLGDRRREEQVSDNLSLSSLSILEGVLLKSKTYRRDGQSPETVSFRVSAASTSASPQEKFNQKNRTLISLLFEKYFYKIAQKEEKIAQFQPILSSPSGRSESNNKSWIIFARRESESAKNYPKGSESLAAAPFINLTNKSSYWWLDAISSFAPFEFSHMQFLARNKNSQFILQNDSKQEFSRTDTDSLAYVGNEAAPFPYLTGILFSPKEKINSKSEAFQRDRQESLSSSQMEIKQISSLLFHFCCILSLVSISQIRGLLKFYLLIFSKISKATVGILTTLTIFSSASFHLLKNRQSSTLFPPPSSASLWQRSLWEGTKQPSLRPEEEDNFRSERNQSLPCWKLSKRGTKLSNREERPSGGLSWTISTISTISSSEKQQPFLNLLHELSSFNKYDQTSKMSYSITKTQPLFLWNRPFSSFPKGVASLKQFAQARISPLRKEATPALSSSQREREGKSRETEKGAQRLRSLLANFQQRGILTTRLSFTKIYTQVYSLRLANFMLKNSYVLYLKTNGILKQTFDLLAIVAPRSLFSFFEKPGELIMDWIAFLFLVEWASDMTNNIPENVDSFFGNSLFKTTRHIYGMLLQNASYFFPTGAHQYFSLPSEKYSWFYYSDGSFSPEESFTPPLLSLGQFPAAREEATPFAFGTKKEEGSFLQYPKGSRDGGESLVTDIFTDNSQSLTNNRENALFISSFNIMESFLRNVTLLNYGSLFIKRLFFSLYELLLFELYQPDTDLMIRHKKGVIFWDIWGDFLMQVAEDSNINVSELASLKEEQIKLLELLSLQNIPFSIRDSKQLFSVVLKKSPYSTKHQREFAFRDVLEIIHPALFSLGQFPAERAGCQRLADNNKDPFIINQDLTKAKRETIKLILTQETLPEGPSSENYPPFSQRKQSFPQQYLSYQGKDTELFIDLHPPKSFSMVSFLKNQESVQYPVGSLVCQIYAGIMSKQISKNILVVGSSGIEKTLLIQAIAGETEIKIITDNAYRYAMVYRGVAVGIKLLRDVFDSLALHTPCLFLIEDIHAIGERRPLLISDDENTKGAEGTGFASHQREEILPPGEKNLIFYELSKHMVTHYRKPYKGDFSMLIPTNLFCFDLWKNNKLAEGLVPSFERSNALSLVFGKKGSSSTADGENTFNGSSGNQLAGSGYYPFKNEKVPPNPLSMFGRPSGTKQTNNSQNTIFSSLLPTSSILFSSKSLFKNSVSSKNQSRPDGRAASLPKGSQLNQISFEGQYMSPRKIVVEKPWGCEPVSMGNVSIDGSTGASMTSAVATKGDTSTNEGISNGLLSKPFNSIRVKVAILADTAISTLSVKLDMITDLLVIIDSVKANRGFVVFATTHVPFILDPALRRPGRLDETITLGLFPNLLSRWEILKSSFALFYAGKEQSGFSKGFSLDFLTPGFSLPDFRKLCVRMSDLRSIKGAKTTEIDFKRFATKSPVLNYPLFRTGRMKLMSSLRVSRVEQQETRLPLFENLPCWKLSKRGTKSEACLTRREGQQTLSAISWRRADSPLVEQTHFGSAPIYEQEPASATISSALFRKKSSLLQLGQKGTENKWCMLSKTKFRSLQKAYFYASVMLNEANLRTERNKVLLSSRSINKQFLDIASSVSLLSLQEQELTNTPPGSSLSPLAFKSEASFAPREGQQGYFAGSSNPALLGRAGNSILNEISPLYMSLYASPELFKKHIGTYMSGKLGEMLFFSSSFMYTSKTLTQASYFGKKQPSFSYGLSNTWHAISSLVLSFIHKRFLYHSHLMLPKFLNFNNAMPLLEAPSPPSSNILLPARRYENYKRSFSYFNQTASSVAAEAKNLSVGQAGCQRLADGILEKIQIHRQQRLVKKLYSLPSLFEERAESIHSKRKPSSENNGVNHFQKQSLPFAERGTKTKQEVGEAYTSLMVGSLTSALQKVSNTNFFIKNKIFIRHKNYLINQWSTGQFPEHNAESTYLSDIDWRYTFVESIGDLLLDFPDADQHYNPRNRRWLLTKGAKAYHNWFDFEKTLYSEIYSHFIFDSFIKAYASYEQNREILDFYAFYILKNASVSDFGYPIKDVMSKGGVAQQFIANKTLVPKINEFETLKLYKRFFSS